jgi:hypothetical protein
LVDVDAEEAAAEETEVEEARSVEVEVGVPVVDILTERFGWYPEQGSVNSNSREPRLSSALSCTQRAMFTVGRRLGWAIGVLTRVEGRKVKNKIDEAKSGSVFFFSFKSARGKYLFDVEGLALARY